MHLRHVHVEDLSPSYVQLEMKDWYWNVLMECHISTEEDIEWNPGYIKKKIRVLGNDANTTKFQSKTNAPYVLKI